jgi:peptidoglycan/LPS O-acetylase OafA/YrhL
MVENKISTSKESDRLPSIDLLRFIAAIMVASMHWGLEIGSERYRPVYQIPILGDLVRNGSYGVQIFFVISGFVIIGAAQRYRSIEFIFARFTRLFPGLLISMLIVLPIGSYFIQPYEAPFNSLLHSIFLTYQVAGVQPLATPLWTLIIEIKFYFGIAVALLLFPRLFKSNKGIVFLLVLWELSIVAFQNLNPPVGTFLLPYLTLNGSHNLFALGICLYLISNLKPDNAFGTLLVVLPSFHFMYKVFLNSGYPIAVNVYIAVASILMILSKKIVVRSAVQRFVYWLGLSSYLIYLLHEHVGMALILQLQSRVSTNIFFLVGMTTVLLTLSCIFLAVFVEKPLQKYLKGLFRKNRWFSMRSENF